jgi:NADPH:quinone reductase
VSFGLRTVFTYPFDVWVKTYTAPILMTAISESMRCIDIAAPGGPEVLHVATRPVPRPRPGEVLVRTLAAGLNRADLLQRQGHYPPPPGASRILGMEVSGHIAELGPGATSRWHVGDAVCALLAGGGYAEYCAVPEGQCMAAPAGVSIRDAAAIPEAVITVWANLFEPRRLFAGDLFLVQGGSSGIGTTAIQMARAFGARVATTAGSDEKCSFCVGLGAEVAVNYRANYPTGDWAAELARWAQPHGIDAILDMIGGDYFPKHIDLLATGGRLVHIATAHGNQVTADLRAIMMKRLLVTGSTLRSRSVAEKSSLARAVEHEVWPLFNSGQLRPIIDSAFPLAQAADAHRLMESGRHTGKIVLLMD